MSNKEKIAEHLNDCLAASKQDNAWVFVRKDIIADALTLLKEQEAIEPTIDKYGNKRCGNCGHKLQSIADMDLFCCKCGRSVKWDG